MENEYGGENMNIKKNHIENSRAIFDEIEKKQSDRDSRLHLFFDDDDSNSVLNFSLFSSDFGP